MWNKNKYHNPVNDVRKIHFINRVDYKNAGDWYCTPILYYYDYFKHYNIIRHDIGFVNFAEINADDVVILGGGGLFDCTEQFNITINRLLDSCNNVIAWSCGFNTHNERWAFGKNFEPIQFEKMKLTSIRDYNHPSKFEYVPCPSSFIWGKYIGKNMELKRKIGFIGHKDLGDKLGFITDSISNSENINVIAQYILTSEAIITSSYHCAYWSMLLGKKTIIINKFSNKFDYYKYRPGFVNISDDVCANEARKIIEKALEQTTEYTGLYDEACELNDCFFSRVKQIIKKCKIPHTNDYKYLYDLSCGQAWNRLVVQEKLEQKLFDFHEDIYARVNILDKKCKELRKENESLKEIIAEISADRM